MSFYQSLQLDPFMLKQKIKESPSKKEKYFFLNALVIRDVLLILFAILFIQMITYFFGSGNSGYGVVLFCMLLSIRFVDFGYKAGEAIGGMAVILCILFCAPLINGLALPFLKLILNASALVVLFFLTSSQPQMGNASLYSFSYLFLSSGSQTKNSQLLENRVEMVLLFFIFLSFLYFKKHQDKHRNLTFKKMLLAEGWLGKRNLWLLRYAIGVSLLLFIGDFLDFPRFVWAGFAFSSILGSYELVETRQRCWDRMIGVAVGSVLFWLFASFPSSYDLSFLGIFGGLALGLSATYRYKTIYNCFGALSIGVVLFGLKEAIIIRIAANLLGVFLAIVYILILKKLSKGKKIFIGS